MQEILNLIEKEDKKALVLMAGQIINRIAEIEKKLRRKRLIYVDPNSKSAIEKQELDMFRKDTEALELQEELDTLKAQLKTITMALEVLQPASSEVFILNGGSL